MVASTYVEYYGGSSSSSSPTFVALEKNISLYVEEEHVQSIHTDVDLSGIGLHLVIFNKAGDEVLHVANNVLVKNSSYIGFTVTSAITDLHERYTYALRRDTDNKVLQKGKIYVKHAPFHTAP